MNKFTKLPASPLLVLQGGGLVRSAGGDKRGLLGRKKGEREKGDQRILGSGDFVANVMKDANEVLDQTAKFDISLDELISRVCAKFEIKVKDLISTSRKRCLSQARAVLLKCSMKMPLVFATA